MNTLQQLNKLITLGQETFDTAPDKRLLSDLNVQHRKCNSLNGQWGTKAIPPMDEWEYGITALISGQMVMTFAEMGETPKAFQAALVAGDELFSAMCDGDRNLAGHLTPAFELAVFHVLLRAMGQMPPDIAKRVLTLHTKTLQAKPEGFDK